MQTILRENKISRVKSFKCVAFRCALKIEKFQLHEKRNALLFSKTIFCNMKAIVILLISSCGLFTASSCRQCTVCHKYPQPDIELCKKDYASDDSYDGAYRYTISLGYDCSRR
jgi:hypothetical protein